MWLVLDCMNGVPIYGINQEKNIHGKNLDFLVKQTSLDHTSIDVLCMYKQFCFMNNFSFPVLFCI